MHNKISFFFITCFPLFWSFFFYFFKKQDFWVSRIFLKKKNPDLERMGGRGREAVCRAVLCSERRRPWLKRGGGLSETTEPDPGPRLELVDLCSALRSRTTLAWAARGRKSVRLNNYTISKAARKDPVIGFNANARLDYSRCPSILPGIVPFFRPSVWHTNTHTNASSGQGGARRNVVDTENVSQE